MTVALYRTGRFFARATRAFNHLAAGTLRIADLRQGIEQTWEQGSAPDAAVQSGLLPWEQQLVDRFVKREDRVLVVGSGPGRDFLPLVAKGCRVTGIEPARRAIATARRHLEERGLSAEIIEGFIEDVEIPGAFDVIIFSHCCYSFIPESRRRIAALLKAADHLSPDGRIIVSYMTEQSGHPLLVRLAAIAATVSRSDWRPEPGDILHPVATAQPLFHYEHPFRPAEIDREASAAGLGVVCRANPPADAFVVLQKPALSSGTTPPLLSPVGTR